MINNAILGVIAGGRISGGTPSFDSSHLFTFGSTVPRGRKWVYPSMASFDQPDVAPSSQASGASSYDDEHVAIVYGSTINVYSMTPFTLLASPTGGSPDTAQRCHYRPTGGYLAVTSFVSPYILIYDTSTVPYTKIANPGTLPTGTAFSCRFNNAGTLLAVGHSSGRITVYNFPALTVNTVILHPGAHRDLCFSPDDAHLAVVSGFGTHNLRIFETTGWTVAATPTQPSGESWAVRYSPDGSLLVVGHATTPFISTYQPLASYTKNSNPAVIPTSTSNTVDFSANGSEFTVGTSGAEGLRRYRSSDLLSLTTSSINPVGALVYNKVSV